MDTGVPEFWWPIDFSPQGEKVFLDQKKHYAKNAVTIDSNNLEITNRLIEKMMKDNLQDILDRDSIPNLCHVLNGWGNSKHKGEYLINELNTFIFLKDGTKPFIEQCTSEGDFHPWQSFAYVAMAGVSGDTIINGAANAKLLDLMKNSTEINHDEGEELGHLLFALGYYFKDKNELLFKFKNGEFNTDQLLNWAIENHFTGSFRVCRKFHLTEGICAIAHFNSNFSEYKLVAQKFLNGQVDLIFLINKIIEESHEAIENNRPLNENSIVHEYREELVVLDYLENHVYYAGHIIELASLSILMGYEINLAQKNAIKSTINNLNKIITAYAAKMSFIDCFLGFGHYRRAMTLFSEIEKTTDVVGNWGLLKKYTVDFDKIEPIKFTKTETEIAENLLSLKIFQVTDPQERINPMLREIIGHYENNPKSEKYPLLGKFAHFRRVCPNNWPKSVHFEMLDYGEKNRKVGIEIHLESENVKYINKHFEDLKKRIEQDFEELDFMIDRIWYKGAGRIFAYCDYDKNPEFIADAFLQLIESSIEKLDKVLRLEYIK